MKIILMGLLICLSGCGKAVANDMHLETLHAADGTMCYIVVQSGTASGLSCK